MALPPSSAVTGGWVALARRHVRLLALAGVVGFALGALVGSAQHPATTASTLVTVTALPQDPLSPGAGSTSVNIDTERQVARSLPVAERAVAALGEARAPADLLSFLSVTATDPRSTVLRFEYTADDPAAAQRRVDALAQAYLDKRRADVEERRDQALALVDAEIVKTRADWSSAVDKAATTTGSGRTVAEQERDGLRRRLDDLASRRLQIALTDPNPGALVPTSGPRTAGGEVPPLLTGLAGLVLGVLACLGVLVGIDRARGRIRSTEALADLLGPGGYLVNLPEARLGDPAGADGVRRLAAHLLGADGHRTVLVTAPAGSRLGPAVAVDLASAVAWGGRRVILVWADCRTTPASEVLGVIDTGASIGVVRRAVPVAAGLVRLADRRNLAVLPGPPVGDPRVAHLVRWSGLGAVLPELHAVADLVVVLAPSFEFPDAAELVPLVDRVVLAVDVTTATQAALNGAVEELGSLGVERIAAVTVGLKDAA